MKNYNTYILILAATVMMGSAQAQTINWAGLREENRHIINVNMGLEYGAIYGLGYGYHFPARLFPFITTIEYSFPSGHTIFDDFKSKVGVQISLIEFHNFRFNARLQGVFRRYENALVRFTNFGSDISGVIGYYRSRWFVAAEVGFDKAIVTQFKHSELYADRFPGVVNGWYEPATGGNLYYGLQTGFSLKKHDIYLKADYVITQDFKNRPMIPYYAQLGYNFRFN